jgi:DNA-binding CsgD family transcriptional regulator/Flp pilus assembly protein TadD
MHLREGAVQMAEADAAAAAEVGAAHGLHPTDPMASGFLIDALRERGELGDAERALRDARAPEPIPDAAIFQMLLFARGRLRLARGQTREGLEDVLLAGRREVEIGGVTPAGMEWRSTAAIAYARLGEKDEARRLAGEELELAHAFGAARAIGIALRATGLAEGGERGIEILGEAAELLADSDARLEHARALVELGAAMRRAGRRREARAPLSEGRELAIDCGAKALSESALEELRASGARPRRSALRGPDSLTPSELRVAQMAAGGRSNRKIAEDLFVTVRTVESHLSQAYGKLEISSRRELSGALGEPDGRDQ